MSSRVRHTVLAALFVLVLPLTACAVTLDDIVALSKAGVTDES